MMLGMLALLFSSPSFEAGLGSISDELRIIDDDALDGLIELDGTMLLRLNKLALFRLRPLLLAGVVNREAVSSGVVTVVKTKVGLTVSVMVATVVLLERSRKRMGGLLELRENKS